MSQSILLHLYDSFMSKADDLKKCGISRIYRLLPSLAVGALYHFTEENL